MSQAAKQMYTWLRTPNNARYINRERVCLQLYIMSYSLLFAVQHRSEDNMVANPDCGARVLVVPRSRVQYQVGRLDQPGGESALFP
jgi:hypothetical protein